MGGSPEEIVAAQADALQRSVTFFKQAISKPSVPPVPIAKSKAKKGSNGWLVIAIAVALSVAALATRKRSRL